MVNRLFIGLLATLLLFSCKSKKVVSAASYDAVSADSVFSASAQTIIDSLVSHSQLEIDEITVTISRCDSDSVMQEKKITYKGITFSRHDSAVSSSSVATKAVATSSTDTHSQSSLESRTRPSSVSVGWLLLLSAVVLLLLLLLYQRLKRK